MNFGYRMGYCTSNTAWDRVQAFHRVARRREAFMTVAERKALQLAAPPDLDRFLKAHLLSCAGERPAGAPLLVQEHGKCWQVADWVEGVQVARKAAGLSDDVVAYTLRHVAISELCAAGIDPLTVARIAGTSVQMIDSNYRHQFRDRVADKLAAARIL